MIVHKSTTEYLQILTETGTADKKLLPKLSDKEIQTAYEAMMIGRLFDAKMLALQRQGRIATFAEIRGQEAANIGFAMAMGKSDWLVQAFRENAATIYLGVPMENILLYYGGDERGNQMPDSVNILPVSVPVGSQTLHAAGIAWGMKMKKKKTACIGVFGDGATSEGDFHEALNFAGVFNLPVVFICQNNQYAISLPRAQQTVSKTIAQKAHAYGIQGIQVDGNDFFAVYKATSEALKNAKAGKGATLIECVTYRLANHTTADDWIKYRTEKEVKEWQKKDPITRLQKYMQANKMWTKSYEQQVVENATHQIEAAVKKFESIKAPTTDDIFKYQYKEMTDELKEQLEYAKEVQLSAPK